MLYQLGPLAIDTMPFSADSMGRDGGGDLAAKDVMSRLRPREFMGEADEKIQISGQLLPTKIGGLTELEMAHAMSRSGKRSSFSRICRRASSPMTRWKLRTMTG